MFKEIPANSRSLARRKPLFGTGINDSLYMVYMNHNGSNIRCPYYVVWSNMIERCYSSKYHKRKPTYKGCTVCDEWLLFSKFKEWMIKQDWNGSHLDKDLLIHGNKVYSPVTCLFVDPDVNLLINDNRAKTSNFPVGVRLNITSKKYQASVKSKGKEKYLGCFDTLELAFEAYKKAKYEIIKEVALRQCEPLRSALLSYRIT